VVLVLAVRHRQQAERVHLDKVTAELTNRLEVQAAAAAELDLPQLHQRKATDQIRILNTQEAEAAQV
jgi:hypothetical protein